MKMAGEFRTHTRQLEKYQLEKKEFPRLQF